MSISPRITFAPRKPFARSGNSIFHGAKMILSTWKMSFLGSKFVLAPCNWSLLVGKTFPHGAKFILATITLDISGGFSKVSMVFDHFSPRKRCFPLKTRRHRQKKRRSHQRIGKPSAGEMPEPDGLPALIQEFELGIGHQRCQRLHRGETLS